MPRPTGKVTPLPGWQKRPGAKPEEVDQDAFRRQRIYAATAELVIERGFRQTSPRDIAARAHVGVATFYRLFADKHEAYLGMLDDTVRAARRAVDDALSLAAPPWPLRVGAALEAFLLYAEAEPARILACIDGAFQAGPEAIDRYNRALDRWVGLLRQGRLEEPRMPAAPATLEEAAVCGTARVLRGHLHTSNPPRPHTLFPDLITFLISPDTIQNHSPSLTNTPSLLYRTDAFSGGRQGKEKQAAP